MTVAQDTRWRAELEIIQELGKIPSSREMARLLKEKKGITVTHKIVVDDLKRDLEFLTKEEFTNQKNGILSMLDTEINIAHNIVTSEADSELKLKAMNTVSKLSKTKSEILIKFRQAQTKLSKTEKPIINVSIGKPVEIDMKNFKKLEKKENEAESTN